MIKKITSDDGWTFVNVNDVCKYAFVTRKYPELEKLDGAALLAALRAK